MLYIDIPAILPSNKDYSSTFETAVIYCPLLLGWCKKGGYSQLEISNTPMYNPQSPEQLFATYLLRD